MKFNNLLLYLLLFVLLSCFPNEVKIDLDECKFINYTPSTVIPFWFWNGNLTQDELRKQIILMHEAGISEVIIHPRIGLKQEYLSEEWFNFFEYALNELSNRKMKVWIYDEFDWPSGRANGKILDKYPELIEKNLKIIKINGPSYRLLNDKFNARKIISVIFSNIDNSTNVKDKYCNDNNCFFDNYHNNSIYIFYQDYSHYRTEFSKQYYVDLLNPITTQLFVNLTHEEYYKRYPDYFGNTIVGFYTDEPGFYSHGHSDLDIASIPWSEYLIDYFYGQKAYNLTDNLFYIWFNDAGNKSEKIKHDYFEVRTKLYTNNYFGTLKNWTQNHNVLFSGHLHSEEDLNSIILYEGDFFSAMQYFDIPGTDEILNFDEDKITTNLLNSAKVLYNKTCSSTESFGGYGENLSYERVVEVTDWLKNSGVDIIILHAFFYSNQTKDYQPSFFYQNNNLWPHIKDYVEYNNEFYVEKPTEQPRIVIYPIEKAWNVFNPYNSSAVDELDKQLKSEIKTYKDSDIPFIIVPDYLILS